MLHSTVDPFPDGNDENKISFFAFACYINMHITHWYV